MSKYLYSTLVTFILWWQSLWRNVIHFISFAIKNKCNELCLTNKQIFKDTNWFIRSVSDTRLPIENYINVQITNDGYMWWYYPVTLKSSCLLNVKYFPFDQQACPLEFGSWTYDGSMVRFFPYPPPSPVSMEQISSGLSYRNIFYFLFRSTFSDKFD